MGLKKYFVNLFSGISTAFSGLKLTLKHIWQAKRKRKSLYVNHEEYFKQKDGIVTLQYPHQKLPVPDHGRYQLHNEIDDCIVCDKCAKICPVNCIDIEPIKATTSFGTTSDGTPKRIYAAVFDIDMAKCCFCGLCTTVCPTECLTMKDEYDFSVTNIADMNYAFANLSPDEIEEKKALLAEFLKEKESSKSPENSKTDSDSPKKKIIFKPHIKPKKKDD